MKPYVKIPLKIISYAIVVFAVTMAVLLVGVRVFDIQLYVVISGSMEPEYPTGSMIYVKEVDVSTLQEGDVITFKLTGNTTATHRIETVVKDEATGELIGFITKGDANEVNDGDVPLDPDKVIGTPLWKIPKLGYVAAFIQSPPGCYYAISAGVCAMLVVTVIDLVTSDGKKKKKAQDDESVSDTEANGENN